MFHGFLYPIFKRNRKTAHSAFYHFSRRLWMHTYTHCEVQTNNICIQVAQLWQRDRASSINDFRWGSIWGYYRLKSYFSRHCDMTQFTLTHHMANKPFHLLGLAAEYRSRRRRRWCDKHCGRPSDVYDTDRRTKLTALKTISRWLLLKKTKKITLWATF